ncbi:MAG: MptD family putative ECF transporter S component [Anaerotignum sp.]|nr:MptD family putative ECF transporter S component [Anaerotignum sp.]
MKTIDKTNKLTSRDLISLGIFNAIAIIGYMVIGSIACLTIIGMFVSTAADFLILGVVYMLMAMKVKKRGVFIICGILLAIVGLTFGRIDHAVACVIGGFLAELIAGKYGNIKRIVIAYVTLAYFDFVGTYLSSFILGVDYFTSVGEKFGMTAEVMEPYATYFGGLGFAILSVVNLICAFLGALIGIGILKKHFKKAGLIK